MLVRILATVIGVAAVAVLGALASSSGSDRVPDEDAKAASESLSAKDNANCGNANRVQAGDLVADMQRLTYRGYVVQKLSKKVREDIPPEYGPSRLVDVSYAAINRRGKVVARFDAGVYFGLGNSIEMGFFSLLDNGRKQLIVSQDVPRGGNQWIVDFDQTVRVVFDGQQFEVGREAYDMTISDLDGDGIYEILVPITAFYGFEGVRLAVSDTPLPSIVFKYDAQLRQYRPANPLFKDCLLKDIEAAEKSLGSGNEQQEKLGDLMSVVLDYIFVGEENRAWALFDTRYKLPDKARIKANIQAILNDQPAYRYIYKKGGNR